MGVFSLRACLNGISSCFDTKSIMKQLSFPDPSLYQHIVVKHSLLRRVSYKYILSLLMATMTEARPTRIHRGAEESPRRCGEVEERKVKKQLAEYVRTEFPKLTAQETSFTSFPANLEQILEASNKGDKAELDVFNKFKSTKIPGLSIALFNGRSYAGKKDPEGFMIPREVDFGAFLTYKGKHKMLLFEVKGSTEDNVGKSLNNTRNHAMGQLKDHKEILGFKHGIGESTLEQVRSCIVWPNLSAKENELCKPCKEKHDRFKPKPEKCKSRRRTGNKDPVPSHHLFEEDLKEFDNWLLKFLESEDNNLPEADWSSCLNVFLLLSVGCLYDEMDQSFIMQSMQQHQLASMPEHEMTTPTFVYGPAGSGKTLSVLAKMEALHQQGKLVEYNKCLFVCKNIELHNYMREELKKKQIPLNNIDFKCFEEIPTFPEPVTMFRPLISSYGAIFVDEAEDLGGSFALDKLKSGFKVSSGKKGFFWILFDHLQQSTENSGQRTGQSNPSTIKLTKVYRNSTRCTKFLKDSLISMYDPSTRMGHTIEGPNVQECNLEVNSCQTSLKSEICRTNILYRIADSITHHILEQGIHPGDVAVSFDEHDFETLFDSSEDFVQDIITDFTKKLYPHPQAPLPSCRMEETVLHPHHPKLTECRCKYFVGPYKRLKGLTVKVIYFVSIHGSTPGCNRMAAYTALSRSSCSINLINVKVTNMDIEKYQRQKMEFYKNLHKDDGGVRRNDFSLVLGGSKKHQRLKKILLQTTNKHKIIKDVIVFMKPNGKIGEKTNVPSFPSALGSGLMLPMAEDRVVGTFTTPEGDRMTERQSTSQTFTLRVCDIGPGIWQQMWLVFGPDGEMYFRTISSNDAEPNVNTEPATNTTSDPALSSTFQSSTPSSTLLSSSNTSQSN